MSICGAVSLAAHPSSRPRLSNPTQPETSCVNSSYYIDGVVHDGALALAQDRQSGTRALLPGQTADTERNMNQEPIKVLLIQDRRAETRAILEMLHHAAAGRFTVDSARTLSAGVERLQQHTFNVVLLDVTLPDSTGLPTLIKLLAAAPTLPIVVLGEADDEELAAPAMRLCAP